MMSLSNGGKQNTSEREQSIWTFKSVSLAVFSMVFARTSLME
jgi:hypothetical protein